MSFSSLAFLIRFFPAVILLYYVCPARFRNVFLIMSSLFFYAWGDLKGLIFLAAASAVGYLGHILIKKTEGRKKTAVFVLSLVCVLGMLVVFKYTGLVTQTLNGFGAPLPVISFLPPAGISFFCFTIASFLIDSYRNELEGDPSLIEYLLYVTFFPKLLMGPIVRFREMNAQLSDRTVSSDDLERGALLFVRGLAKKVILADNISALWKDVCEIGFAASSSLLCWVGIIAFAFQLYYDFSGYSDMAMGISLFFGFSIPENFTTPYSSVSVSEFWRRWHITMGAWFRQYVYFPLGGSRCSRLRNVLNLFAVWALTGLWHGASWNYLLWGLFYFVILTLEKNLYGSFLEKNRLIGHVYTTFITLIGWTLFAVTDLSEIPVIFSRMFAGTGGVSALYYLRNYAVLLVVCLLLCTQQASKVWDKLVSNRTARAVATVVLILLSLAYITDSTYQPFLYAQF